MQNESFESLSAAMDSEATSFETRRLVERCASEPELAKKWHRYHLAQQALHNGCVAPIVDQNFVNRIASAVDQVPAYNQADLTEGVSRAKPSQRWWKPMASMAMAASVTAVVILGGQAYNAQEAIPHTQYQQAYTIPSIPTSNHVMRTQYGAAPVETRQHQAASAKPEVLRLSQGLNYYIDQHKHWLGEGNSPAWQANWMPDGFTQLKHEILPYAEVMLFSNGKNTVSVSVEPLARQAAREGVTQSRQYIAVGKRKQGGFVTVVGDVPLMIADRIASSVNPAVKHYD